MKRSRGYNEAVDFLTIKIKKTTCEEFLKKGGIGERIRGGRSHHCLPIDSKGKDVDELKFVGRCLNNDKDIILSIFEVKNKRSHDDGKKHRSLVSARKNDDENVEFYLSLRSSDKPIEYKIKHFNLKNGHAYQVRRPKCIKARNYCTKHKEESKEELMVIDCDRQKQAKGSIDKNDKVYIEITRRDKRPDTCSDSKNGHCCRYVNANPKGGICKLYARKNNYNNNNKGDSKDNHGKDDVSSQSSNSSKNEDEEPILVKENESVDNLLKDMGVNNAEVVDDTKKETSNNESVNAKEETPSTDNKKEASEEEGEEFEVDNEEADSKNPTDSKQSVPSSDVTPNNINAINNNNNDVAAPSNPEKRQATEEEDPEFDMFEDDEVDKKNVVEKSSPVVPIIRKDEPNTIVIPNLKKKKKNQIKSVEEQPTPVVPIKQVEQQPTPVVPIKQVEQQPILPIKQVEQQPTLVEVAPVPLVKDQTEPKKI